MVDAAVLQALVSLAAWSPYPARLVSFAFAVSATFALNRLWTFGARTVRSATAAYGKYLAVQIIGALINLAVFTLCLLAVPRLREWPVVALAAGSAVALAFNFLAARVLVFTAPR